MKLSKGRYQTATQVKVLNPEMNDIEEADSIHCLESRTIYSDKASNRLLFRGLSPWYGIEWLLQEPGRSDMYCSQELFVCDLKKRRSRENISEVGLTHSRGVVGVMSCEIKDSLEGVSRNMKR